MQACNPQVNRLRAIIARRPLCLRIETTNVCNAKCVFCAYSKTRRPKSIMPIRLFEKVAADYADMGGGAVNLTPIVGEPLLDPHLCDRLRILRANAAITRVGMVTNAIAWDRYSPADQRFILESLDRVEISIGGLDADSYRRMYRVDAFDRVRSAIHAMCDIKLRYDVLLDISLEFRVDQPIERLMADPRMDAFRRKGITSIDAMNTFGNWGGMVDSEDVPVGARVVELQHTTAQGRQAKRSPCFVYYMSPAITSDGSVTACGCMNAEAREPIIGDIKNTHLQDIWCGEPLRRFIASFGTDALPDICANCTSYQDGHTWLHNPALAHFRIGDDPWDVIRKHVPPPPGSALSEAIKRLVRQGYQRIAIYSAGKFSKTALAAIPAPTNAFPIVAVVDDDPGNQGETIDGLPVVSTDQAMTLRIDAAVIGSQWYAWELWQTSRGLRGAGVHVIPLDDAYVLPPALK
jgi:MoaA/NifB/PqqE/SkfB family radical SAM enzyme